MSSTRWVVLSVLTVFVLSGCADDTSKKTDKFTITATAGAGGSINPSGAVEVDAGENLTFTITADAEFSISDVIVDGSSVGAVSSHTFYSVDADHTIEARFSDGRYILNVNVVGNGSVSINPDSGTYAAGALVSLTAVPQTGWTFNRWEGDLTGTENPSELVMDADMAITAIFIEEGTEEYSLSLSTVGNGMVTVSPNLGSYPHGTLVTLTPMPDAGWAFDHWEGDLIGTDTPGQLTMVADASVTAVFVEALYTLEVDTQGSGTVTVDPNQAGYQHGSMVSLTANPAAGWAFDHWEGSLSGNANPAQFAINEDMQVTAVFVELQYTLSISITGNGGVTQNPEQASYPHGTVVSLTATADSNWLFDHWEGDLDSAINPAQIVMNGNKSITAVFVPGQYTLAVNTYGSGTVTSDPDQVGYQPGTLVTLTAVPAAGWVFDRWESDLSGSANPAQITMDSDKTVSAVFVQEQYTLTVNVTGQGNVTRNPNQATYFHGSQVSLTAVPAGGWAFDHWEGDMTGSVNPDRITMDGNKTVTAVFAPAFTLDVQVNGSGSVAVDPDLATYPQDAVVTLTATADPGWSFDRWEGDLTGSDNPALLTMDGSKAVVAVFTQNEYTLTVGATGSGSVTKNPDQATYHYDNLVSLTAVPDAGWVFDHWEGDASGSDNPLDFTVQDNATVTAVFVSPQYTLGTSVVGSGSLTLNPDQATYGHNQVVTLTAVPDPGFIFDHWEGDLTGAANPAQLTMDADKTVTAHFVAGQYTLTVSVAGSGSVTRDPDQAGYDYGTVVTLTPVPDANWNFDHWEGDLTGNANPAQVTMNADLTVVAVFSGQCPILLVDDDAGASHEAAFEAALDANGCTYDSWDVSAQGAAPGLSDLADYGMVIWTTGADYGFGTPETLKPADQTALMAYLDAGGRLFLSSQEVLYDNSGSEPFFTDYLHVGAHTDDQSVSSVTGTADVVSGNTDSISLSYPFTNYADDISADSVSQVSFHNNNGEVSGIRSEVDPFRTVFFAFPFEAIPNSAPDYHRDRIMGNIVSWLCAAITPDTTPPTVTITSPGQGATVSGMTLITVDAVDDRMVDRVAFRIDGGAWEFEYSQPFTHVWDTTGVADGPHTIEAQAFDRADNQSDIDSVDVTVDQSFNQTEKYALVIGVSDYQAISDLSYCDEDASEWFHYLTMKGYNHIWVLGDGHPGDFPQYDGDATEANIRNHVRDIVAMADSNDWIAITFSGHGAGDGNWNSFYCAYDNGVGGSGEDGDYDDVELVQDLSPSIAQQIFIFFDSCYSGGMGDDLMDMNTVYPLYCTTTCTENGYGWDDPTHQMGAWTWQYLIDTLRNHYADNNVDQETAFDYAHSNYPHSGGDECMEFDSHPGNPFYLALPPWTPPKQNPGAAKRQAPAHAGSTLGEMLEGASGLEVRRTRFAGTEKKTRVDANRGWDDIRTLLEPGQRLQSVASRCVFSHSLTFLKDTGKPLGAVGLCHNPLAEPFVEAVFVPAQADGQNGMRHGLSIRAARELTDLLETHLR